MGQFMRHNMTEAEIQDKAKEAAGNWMKFPDFLWDLSARPKDPENWCIIHTRTRDSEAIDRANARAVEGAMMPFTKGRNPTVRLTRFNHWAVGWIDAVVVKVFLRNGKISPAFTKMFELNQRLTEYPVLDEQFLAEEEREDNDD
jgi:hypothetical protein